MKLFKNQNEKIAFLNLFLFFIIISLLRWIFSILLNGFWIHDLTQSVFSLIQWFLIAFESIIILNVLGRLISKRIKRTCECESGTAVKRHSSNCKWMNSIFKD